MSRIAICLAAIFIGGGCASDRDVQNDHLDSLWKQGYGYGNPNVERIRSGQKPESFYKD